MEDGEGVIRRVETELDFREANHDDLMYGLELSLRARRLTRGDRRETRMLNESIVSTVTTITVFSKPGKLAIRGPVVRNVYSGGPRNADFDDEGHFRTGDIMYCEADTGKWHIVHCKKDRIKILGFQVARAETEGVLLEHPDIGDATFPGVKVPADDGVMPRAYLVKKSGVKLDKLSVVQRVEAKPAKYKWLVSVRFVDFLPRIASGKIVRMARRSNL
jgi:acyl-CoA synthetase (AMP-forming)/AMP-acid ligase II